MKRRFLVSTIAMASFIAASGRAQPAGWQTIVGRDLRFRVEMPAPATESKAAEKEKGHESERIGWASKLNGEMFDFDYVDYQAGWYRDLFARSELLHQVEPAPLRIGPVLSLYRIVRPESPADGDT